MKAYEYSLVRDCKGVKAGTTVLIMTREFDRMEHHLTNEKVVLDRCIIRFYDFSTKETHTVKCYFPNDIAQYNLGAGVAHSIFEF